MRCRTLQHLSCSQRLVIHCITRMLIYVQGALHPELPTIDVSEELHYLWSCQQVFTPSKAVLQQIVIDAQGSLPTTVSMLLEWAQPSQARRHAACQDLWSACNDPLQQSWQGVEPASNGSEGSSARVVASCKAFSQGWQQQQAQLLTEAMQGAGVPLLCHFVCCIHTINISNKQPLQASSHLHQSNLMKVSCFVIRDKISAASEMCPQC